MLSRIYGEGVQNPFHLFIFSVKIQKEVLEVARTYMNIIHSIRVLLQEK
jgi:hypothetical protein